MTDIGRSRRQWRQAFFILLGVAGAVVGVLLIAVTSRKVSYARESNDAAVGEQQMLARLLEAQQPPATRATVLRVLRRESPKARIVATDSTVALGALTFHFTRAGKLVAVETR